MARTKLKNRVTSETIRQSIYEEVKEYIRITPRDKIVNKETREFKPLIYRIVSSIFRNHGYKMETHNAVEDYLDKNFILRT